MTNEAGLESFNGFDYVRVRDWALNDPKPANIAFTAGPERNVAYLIEDLMLRNVQMKINNLKLAEFCIKRATTEDALEPSHHVYQLAKKVFKESYGYEYGEGTK